MTTRKDRLKKLVKVQEQLKALHETRHAGFLAAAVKAEAEAKELIEHFDTDRSLAGLFPALYHKRITDALGRQKQNLEDAKHEAALIATATARTNMVERAYKDVRRRDERERSDRERLDLITQKRAEE
ncbi:MAG: hypothetical protein E5V91_01415 [Mesorhizobium sp.]|uniref:hypothetical protein n=1 Tax=unclassified Mesorhizobium TaxID=325217 RepID=UPI000FCB4F4E|nr:MULTISPECIES: hypothetical protein [unclassified Mesorhizobium]RUW41096.1 hypothetical protein EOA37_11865 [Mesorhizobium sp. M2A.F.Ca.ET.015.02.1.1]RUW67422.1 hypothetical protein EOA28_29050 [Mesorhizobium sp. M2A.F.Ca.ET.067.02.1.1]RVC97529.1 hypothetical protein EN739_04085 [Mesorhizobium sp. M2A.F.Ca.ET.017.03.2.1]RVD10855.1 hypothetical protein EN753_04795 [Mesorhizobium sp. M2A.F.Ca.ET.029.05.1.1]RWB43439.1 MAG: hypothetical protein EOQ46_17270 [Mesorhizobium sp.]